MKMSVTPAQVFERYFAELERQGVAAVVLHSYAELPDCIASDIDYAVSNADLGRARSVLREVASSAGWVVAQTLQHESDGLLFGRR